MPRYAENTKVASSRSRDEIERTLARYGATGFVYGWHERDAMIAFEMQQLRIRFVLPMPQPDDPEITETPTGRERSQSQQREMLDKATRQRWRALALAIKAKLEAVESGISQFEEEFLAHIIVPGTNWTVGDDVIKRIQHGYSSKESTPLLPHLE